MVRLGLVGIRTDPMPYVRTLFDRAQDAGPSIPLDHLRSSSARERERTSAASERTSKSKRKVQSKSNIASTSSGGSTKRGGRAHGNNQSVGPASPPPLSASSENHLGRIDYGYDPPEDDGHGFVLQDEDEDADADDDEHDHDRDRRGQGHSRGHSRGHGHDRDRDQDQAQDTNAGTSDESEDEMEWEGERLVRAHEGE